MTKKNKKADPFHEREAQKYEHPVPSREFIIQYLEKIDQPASFADLMEVFSLKSKEEQEGLRRRLIAMERDAQLIANRRGSYGLVKNMELIPGRVEATREGFGFLVPDAGGDDIFLSTKQMRGVFHGDRVLVHIAGFDARGRREGIIVEVLEHNTKHIVGRYYEEDGVAFVDPDNKLINQDIIIPSDQQGSAQHGQFVTVEIVSQPSMRRQALGKVTEVLGDPTTAGMEVELSLRSHDIPFIWSQEVLNETAQLPKVVDVADVYGREDLRHLAFVTIDGEDAKDFDDAVYCERYQNGWKLYVAIADVSHYVRPSSALDVEARLRGNSVYFPSRVIPMLPEALSNELCSLKPNVDRLVMYCEMVLNAEGKVKNFHFGEGVIHSQARLTYNEVAAMLEGNQTPHVHLLPQLQEFHNLYQKLQKQRELRGAIEFEMPENRVVFGDKGKIKRIIVVQRNVAHRMIEEAMLLANVCAAQLLEDSKLPTLYRVHEGPEAKKLEALHDFLKAFGLHLTGGKNPSAKDYSKLLQRLQSRPDAHLLQTVMLRSMRQAIYSPKNAGHFGLSYEGYCHFTSPIRRYPDVVVHRGIKHKIKNKSPKVFLHGETELQHLGEHFSATERRADLATRDSLDWLKCEYMLDKVGQTFEGIISSVTSFGLFIMLKNVFVEGLLHISGLQNDYYHFDATHHLLRGKHSGKVYRLGDEIKVLVARVDLNERKIDFELAGVPGNGGGKKVEAKKPAAKQPRQKKNKKSKSNGRRKKKKL